MSKLTKIFSAVTALAVVAAAGITTANVSAYAAEGEATYSVKEYTPDKYDLVDFYGAGGDIDPAQGDGVTTFAHSGLTTPLEGADISFDTNFKIRSVQSVENGGSGVDGWLTYSFTKEAIPDNQGDGVIPNFGNAGTTQGIFMHITNYSSTSVPNCVEVQFVQNDGTGNVGIATSIFLDNAQDTPFNFSLAKAEDNTYTWTVTRLSDNEVLKTVTGLAFNSDYFVNEDGQTYVSTAIYENCGDADHTAHRGVAIFNVDAYNVDIAADSVVLSQSECTYEGVACTPDVTVTLDGAELVKGVDYDVEYLNNAAVGTATAKVVFYGELGGNVIEKQFEIKAAPVEDTPTTDDNQGADNNDTSAPSDSSVSDDSTSDGANESTDNNTEEKDGGCGSVVAFGSIASMLALGGAVLFARKRK